MSGEFACRYAKPTGEIVETVQMGQSADEIRRRLQEQGFLPIAVRAKSRFGLSRSRSAPRIKPEDLIFFNQQFVSLVRAGLPILKSLDLLRDRIKNPRLQQHLEDVRERVRSGALLSEALAAQGAFPVVYTASVAAGERGGNLEEVLSRYVSYQKTILTVRKRFINSLIYPSFLIVLSLAMVATIITFVIPRFAELYAGLGTELPPLTQLLIAVSGAIEGNLILLLPALIGGIVGLRLWLGTLAGRTAIDQLKLKAPIVGDLWAMFSMAQLSRTLATLLQGGIPLVPALEIAQGATSNRIISRSIVEAVTRVREGQPLSDSLEMSGRFPPLALEMVRVGEQSGSLPEMLNHVADFYDEDVNIRSAALLGWVEPLILIFVAVFVATILIALYLPIFSIRGRLG